jgi:flavin-binding protein dodecin
VAGPFRPATARSRFGRALRSKRVSTFEAIENLLAMCGNVCEVSCDAVAAVCDENQVDLEQQFASERKHLYRRYLAYCLEDRALSQEETVALKHLRGLLHLPKQDVADTHDEVAREIYGKAIAEVLEDLKIDAEEQAFLNRLREELHVSDDVASRLLARGERHARNLAVNHASTPDADFQVSRLSMGEFTGRSDDSFEAAVADALEKAQIAVPRLHWFEVVQIAGYVEEGKAKSWHVTVRCGMATGANV